MTPKWLYQISRLSVRLSIKLYQTLVFHHVISMISQANLIEIKQFQNHIRVVVCVSTYRKYLQSGHFSETKSQILFQKGMADTGQIVCKQYVSNLVIKKRTMFFWKFTQIPIINFFESFAITSVQIGFLQSSWLLHSKFF